MQVYSRFSKCTNCKDFMDRILKEEIEKLRSENKMLKEENEKLKSMSLKKMAPKVKCKKCGDIIQSKHRHDMVWCGCHSVAVDGGDDYCRVVGNTENWEFI